MKRFWGLVSVIQRMLRRHSLESSELLRDFDVYTKHFHLCEWLAISSEASFSSFYLAAASPSLPGPPPSALPAFTFFSVCSGTCRFLIFCLIKREFYFIRFDLNFST
jgi:hypothetical protein